MKKAMSRLWSLLLAVVVMMTALAGCNSGGGGDQKESTDPIPIPAPQLESENEAEPETRVVVDLAGREVIVPYHLERVASLTGPSFETVIMLGGQDQVVMTGNGMPAKDWGPVVCPEYAEFPRTEDATNPNVEEMMEQDVQVALFWDKFPEAIQAMEDAGIAVFVTQLGDEGITSPEELLEFKKREIMCVGELFGGECVERAKMWCDYADETVEKITSRTSKLTEDEIRSVYYVRGPEALQTHGGNSLTRYLVEMAGGELVNKDEYKGLYTTTMEEVLGWDPEVIFMGRVNNVELVTEDPAWAAIQAVTNGDVYINEKSVGPAEYSTDCFLMMEQIAKDLHPELFEDLDMVQEVKDYFKTFYRYELTDEQAEMVLNFQSPSQK